MVWLLMGVVKLSKSGKQLQFITDEGELYCTSTTYAGLLLNGKIKSNFVLLSKMPFGVDKNRFKQSPIYDPEGKYAKLQESDAFKGKNKDAFSGSTKEVLEEQKNFEDKVVW